MTAKSKFEEAKICLNEIETEKEDLKKLRTWISSFFEKISSIYQHSMEEINQKSKLGLDGVWGYKKFRQKAKQTQNQIALQFLEWYDKEWEFHQEIEVPKIIRKIRNEDHHKKDLKLEIQAYQYPADRRDFERPIRMMLEKTGGKQFDSLSEVNEAMEFSTEWHIKEWNKKREELGFPLIQKQDDLVSKLVILFPEYKLVQSVTTCKIVYLIMKDYVTKFQNFKKQLS